MAVKTTGYEKLWQYFGLSYASWLTMSRAMMHEMPDKWQGKMSKLLEEFDDFWDLEKLQDQNFPENIFVMEGYEIFDKCGMEFEEGKHPRKYDIESRGHFYNLFEPKNWVINYRRPDKEILDYIKNKENKE